MTLLEILKEIIFNVDQGREPGPKGLKKNLFNLPEKICVTKAGIGISAATDVNEVMSSR